MTPSKTITCISCVTDQEEYQEQLYYLKRQRIPEDYSLDFFPVTDALSMASGYNFALDNTDSKYRIYLHQDLFIIDPDAVFSAIKLFEANPRLGILGAVGVKGLLENGFHTMDYGFGRIFHNSYPHELTFEYPTPSDAYAPVDSVDGAFIMTSRDIPWREDIFDGWDFYDVSQCREYILAGFEVGVPYQKNVWCYHDNTYSNYGKYYDYKERFIREYFPGVEYTLSESGKRAIEYAGIQTKTVKMLTDMAASGQRESLYQVFRSPDFRGHAHLRELEAIADIDYLESGSDSDKRIWAPGSEVFSAISDLRRLKRLMKRLEYEALEDGREKSIKDISDRFSVYAIIETAEKYAINVRGICGMFLDHYRNHRGSLPEAGVMERFLAAP